LNFFDRFSKKFSNVKFEEIRPAAAALFRAGRQTYEANTRFSLFLESTLELALLQGYLESRRL
jgi:hypothetical protein